MSYKTLNFNQNDKNPNNPNDILDQARFVSPFLVVKDPLFYHFIYLFSYQLRTVDVPIKKRKVTNVRFKASVLDIHPVLP